MKVSRGCGMSKNPSGLSGNWGRDDGIKEPYKASESPKGARGGGNLISSRSIHRGSQVGFTGYGICLI